MEKGEMIIWRRQVLTFVVGLFSATVATADFDGSKQLLCSFGQVTECDAGEVCREVSHESVDAPDFVVFAESPIPYPCLHISIEGSGKLVPKTELGYKSGKS